MNKKLRVILSLILVIVLLGIQVSYAISANEEEDFFTVSSTEVAQNETLEMTMNLDKIGYNNFKIVLNSNIDSGEIYTDDNVAIEEDSDAIVIEVDKTKLKLSEIKLCYEVTESTGINSKIQLTAKVIVEEEVPKEDEDGNTIYEKQENTLLEETQNVTVVEQSQSTEKENTDEDKKEDSNIDKTDNSKTDSTNKVENTTTENTNKEGKNNTEKSGDTNKSNEQQKNNSNANQQQSSPNNNMSKPSDSNIIQNNNQNSTNTKSSNMNTSSNTGSNKQGTSQGMTEVETATYNGSNNNYLESLKVKGVDLNTDFNKENTTYFVNVTDASTLKITAKAEDDTAKVVITGNDSIKEGTNKILIAVTAENGDVRYYRIFVNCTLS